MMKAIQSLSCLALEACLAAACLGAILHKASLKALSLSKRQKSSVPEPLTKEEASLVGSFDTASMETWSYYYTHSQHLAGLNKSVEDWTADRFRGIWLDNKPNPLL